MQKQYIRYFKENERTAESKILVKFITGGFRKEDA